MRATILVVDDSEDVLNLIQATLSKEHEVRVADNAPTALKLVFEEPRPDLILLDVEMPDVSGYDLCKTLKASAAVADIPVVFLTGRSETRDVVQGFQLGALDYVTKPVSPPVLQARIRNHLELIERRYKQDELLRSRGAELEQTRLELVRRLGRAMEYHESSAIGNRVVRLGHYARALAQAAGARTILTDMLMKAAPLHDIGKVGVPAAILRKSGQLTVPEREQVQRHPEIGAEIIGNHNDPLLKLARTLAFTHHERWDGSGYPTGAAGNEIPWAGRVMAIVDSWESMTVTQFHREPLPLDLAADEIVKGAGRQFDPTMVAAFKKALPEFRRIHATYADQLGDMLNLDFSAAPPAPPKEKQDETRVLQEQAANALRAADAARAKALADAQARLKIEHDLAAAAQKDIVSQHMARKQAEEQAAREAELLAAAKKRATEESTATRFARDRAESDAKAVNLARQRQEADEAAVRAAKERAEAEKAAGEEAKQRAAAESSAQGAALLRVQAEKEAEAAAKQRAQAEAELAALRAAATAGSEGVEELNARIVEDLAAAQAAREAARAAAAAAAPDLAALEARARDAAAQRAEAESQAERLRAGPAQDSERLAALQKQAADDIAAAQAAREAVREATAATADAASVEAQARQAAAERAEAEQAAQAAATARTEAERALEAAILARQEAEAGTAGLREASAGELQRLMAVRKRVEEENAAANAARSAAAEFANIDELMRERMALEEQIQAAANQRAAAEKALEGLREAAERESRALEEAKALLAAGDPEALAAQRAQLEQKIAGIAAERAAVEQGAADAWAGALQAQLDEARRRLAATEQDLATAKADLAAARQAAAPAAAPSAETSPDVASQTIAALQDELRVANAARETAEKAAAEAKAAAKSAQPLVIGPAPVPRRQRAGVIAHVLEHLGDAPPASPAPPRRTAALSAFLLGAALAGAAAYFHFSQLEPAPQAAPRGPVEARPAAIAEPGEPLKLHLDLGYDRIAPKEK